jgi:16S rRNA (guanine1207-N2)-methyltransferase
MRAARLAHALESGQLVLPAEGAVGVFRPDGADDLSALPAGRVRVFTGNALAHRAFSAQGLPVARAPAAPLAAAIVCLPRARDHGRALVAEAIASVGHGGLLVVDGQKQDGIETMQRDLGRAGITPEAVVAKAHGRLLTLRAPASAPDGWAADWREVEPGVFTRPGVFSADGPDPGSALLAANLPEGLAGRVADLGAGWGWLALQALRHPAITQLDLIEAEADALDCARRNIADPRARFVWADALRHRPDALFDAVLCNPPFHAGRPAEPALGQAFIRAAAAMLKPRGTLWLVGNRHLPYEETLRSSFVTVAEVGSSPGFRVWSAQGKRTSRTHGMG